MEIVRPGSLRRILRIAEPTQQHLLHALEAVFLIRKIPVEGDYRGDLIWYEDQVERQYFAGATIADEDDWNTLVYRNARAQFDYRIGEQAGYFHFRTRGGARVPLGIRTPAGVLGIIGVGSRLEINLSLRRSADSFLKRYNHSKVVFVTREGNQSDALNDRVGIVPAQIALF